MLRQNLASLRAEILEKPFYKLEERLRLIALKDLYAAFLKDGKLTKEEYADWIGKFNSRAVLDRKALEEYIRKIK